MSKSVKIARRSSLIVAIAWVFSNATGTAYADSVPAPCTGVPVEGNLTVGQLPSGESARGCSLTGRVVTYGDIGVTIPVPGEGVRIDSQAAAGNPDSGRSLYVQVGLDGVITVDTSEQTVPTGKESASAETAAGSPSGCSDDYFLPFYFEETTSYDWYIGDGGMPGALSKADAQSAFAEAIHNITNSWNDCGMPDTIDSDATYMGTTTYESDISTSSTCLERDGKSTWDAGDIGDGHTATTCTWLRKIDGSMDDSLESDVRFNTHDFDFTDFPTSTCTNKYDIRSTGTHEAGHIFGLGHAPREGHDFLTMAVMGIPCSVAHRTLGRGDLDTLEAIY